MNGPTMKALSEYMADQHRRNQERNKQSGYERIYVQDTNGVEQDDVVDTFWPPESE
jgi:hypothetical protein